MYSKERIYEIFKLGKLYKVISKQAFNKNEDSLLNCYMILTNIEIIEFSNPKYGISSDSVRCTFLLGKNVYVTFFSVDEKTEQLSYIRHAKNFNEFFEIIL